MWYAQLHDSQEWLLSSEVEMVSCAKCRACPAASQMTNYFALRQENTLLMNQLSTSRGCFPAE